jgi:hypothetical protein
MSKNYLTFHSYIQNHNTALTRLFINCFGELVLDKLPDTVCSSKTIYDILRQDLDSYIKQELFRNSFMEYFKWKVLYSINE